MYSLADNFNNQKKQRQKSLIKDKLRLRRDLNFITASKTTHFNDTTILAYAGITLEQQIGNSYMVSQPIFSNQKDCLNYYLDCPDICIGVFLLLKTDVYRKKLVEYTIKGNILQVRSNVLLYLQDIILI